MTPTKPDEESSDYVPFGPEWEAEVMKHRKADLVAMLRKAYMERDAMKTRQITRCCPII